MISLLPNIDLGIFSFDFYFQTCWAWICMTQLSQLHGDNIVVAFILVLHIHLLLTFSQLLELVLIKLLVDMFNGFQIMEGLNIVFRSAQSFIISCDEYIYLNWLTLSITVYACYLFLYWMIHITWVILLHWKPNYCCDLWMPLSYHKRIYPHKTSPLLFVW